MSNQQEKVILTADDRSRSGWNSFTSNSDKASKSLKSFSAIGKRVTGSLFNIKTALVGAIGVGGFGAMVKSSIDAGDKIQKLSTRIGASTEALSQYKHVADLTGVSFQTLGTAWQRQTRRIAEAAQGTGEARAALRELGVDVQKLNGLRPEQQFERLADAFGNVTNQSDKVRLAMKIWDTEGVSMLQTIEGGSASLQEMRAEADRLGLTLSRDQVNAMAKAKDAITRMKASSNALGNELAINLGPTIVDVANALREGLPDGIAFTKKAVLGAVSAFSNMKAKLSEFSSETSLFLGNIFSLGGRFENSVSKHFGEAARKHLTDAMKSYQASAEAYGKQLKIVIGQQEKFNSTVGKALKPVETQTGTDEKFQTDAQQSALRSHHAFLKAKVDAITNYGQTANQKLIESRDRDILTIKEYAAREGWEEERKQLEITKIHEKHNKDRVKITKSTMDLQIGRVQTGLGVLGGLYRQYASIQDQKGREGFEKAKKANTAATKIDTAQAAISAYKALAGIPFVGPALGAAAAGVVIRFGRRQLDAIKATTYQGGGSIGSAPGGGVGGGGGSAGGSSGPPQQTQPQQPPQQLIQPIIIAGGGQDIDQVWDYLRERINRRDGVLVDKDSRQGQVILKGIQ